MHCSTPWTFGRLETSKVFAIYPVLPRIQSTSVRNLIPNVQGVQPDTKAPTSSIRARSFCLCREVECSRLRFFYLICSPFCIPPSLFCWNQSLFCGRCRRVVLLMYLRLSVLMLCARLRSQIFADCDQRCRPLSVLRSW